MSVRRGIAAGLVAVVVAVVLVQGTRVGPGSVVIIVVAVIGVCVLALTRPPRA